MCAICGNDRHDPGFSRRNFLRLLGGATGALALGAGERLFAAGEVPKPQNVLSFDQALARLKQGNDRYVQNAMMHQDFAAERKALAGGQNPFAGILTCADSRVSPEFTFDQGLGDLFVVRVAGNFAEDNGIASFEYAVKFLGVRLLVVLGHEKCGAVDSAIKAMKDGAVLPGHLPELVEHITPAVKAAMNEPGDVLPRDLLANAIRENVLLNVTKLKTASPILSEYVGKGVLHVTGGIYHLATGRVEWVS
jgi:carbonic anhydrase